MAPVFSEEIELIRKSGDSIGSTVECVIEGLPMGIGEPWFDGLEPALARAMMAIPGARSRVQQGLPVINNEGVRTQRYLDNPGRTNFSCI